MEKYPTLAKFLEYPVLCSQGFYLLAQLSLKQSQNDTNLNEKLIKHEICDEFIKL